MLQEDIKTPVLFFAMDNIAESSVSTAGALSIENSEVLQAEIAKKEAYVKQFNLTDISDHLTRVAIPINDRLLPIHFSGGTTSQTHFVDYLDDTAVMTKAGNIVTLRFELKNNLSALSTVADLILGLATKDFFISTQPRVSFFSANLCIFNAYLRGLNRQVVNNTDKEVLSLTLEIAPNKTVADVEAEKAITSFDNELTEGPPAPAPESQGTETFKQITADEIDFSYNWYQVFTVDEINLIEVPDFTTDFTIERENLRLMRVNSSDFQSNIRRMITIEFKEVFTTLEGQAGQVLNEIYGLMMFEDSLYFGIKNAN